MTAQSAKLGIHYPSAAGDAADFVAIFLALLNDIDGLGGISGIFTTVQRDALAGANLWAGRLIYNTTTGRLESYIAAGSWQPVRAADVTGTVAGDTFYATAFGVLARLAAGAAYQTLGMNAAGTAPAWVASLQSLMTAAGDLVYGSSANIAARLPKGADGQVLTLAAGLPSWATPGGLATVGLFHKAGIGPSIPDNTNTAITWDTEDADPDGYHAGSSASLIVPAGKGGKLHCFIANIDIEGNTSVRQTYFKKNGSIVRRISIQACAAGSTNVENTLWIVPADGDTFTIEAYQNSGGALNANPNNSAALHSVQILRVG